MPTTANRRTGKYYIIEHPAKGVLREIECEGEKPMPKYSRTARRNSPKNMRFTDLQKAIELAEKLREVQRPASQTSGRGKRLIDVAIRKAPNFEWRCWDCGGWITTMGLGHRRGCPIAGGGD